MQTVISPLTRISGFLEIEVSIEDGVVTDAKSRGVLFRGFEIMLPGRHPLDAIYFTERVCGICSTAHATAAALALEDALKVKPSRQGNLLRSLIHCCEFLQNHLRHFYQYTVPDFVVLPQEQCLFKATHHDWRLPYALNEKIAAHYFASLEFSRKAHMMLAILGGKAPHDHGITVGGITVDPTVDKLTRFSALLNDIKEFVHGAMVPDAEIIAHYYADYYALGKGYGNLLSYGLFGGNDGLPALYAASGVLVNGDYHQFVPAQITEDLTAAWYQGEAAQQPPAGITVPDMEKQDAYSWVKAPRYGGIPCECGPLARQILSGEYPNDVSMMDRTVARVYETAKIISVMEAILLEIEPGLAVLPEYQIPDAAQGIGLTDTTRGALGHWLAIKDGVFSHYQIVTPSTWNLSPRDSKGQRGAAEQALIGTPVADPQNPVEVGRIIRSFDPCISCATHVYTADGHRVTQII